MRQCVLATRSAAMVIITMIGAAGCSPAVLPATPVPPTTTAEAPVAPSPLPQTPTSQPTPGVTVDSHCIPIEVSAPADLPLSGVWVRNEYIPYLEDTLTQADIRIPLKGGGTLGQWRGDAAVSPDGKYLAYIDQYYDPIIKYQPVKRVLRIISSSGHTLRLDYWKEDWQYIIGWADNQTVALFTSTRMVATLNPFTGDWQGLSEPTWLIDMGYKGDKYGFNSWGSPSFARMPDRVVIPAEGGGFDIRKLRSGDVLFHGAGSEPRPAISWSANGSIFTFISSGHLLTVLKDQAILDLDLQPAGAALDWYNDLELSPAADKTAFTGTNSYPDKQGPRLFVYDRARSKLYMLCNDQFVIGGWRRIAWSPDNRYLVTAIVERTDAWPAAEFDVLLDTQELRAFKLTSGQEQHRLFWLAAP